MRIKKPNKITYAITNVRSLLPKIDSLINCFEEHELTFSIITETWLRADRETMSVLEEVENGAYMELIRKNRGTRAFDTRKARLKKYSLPRNNYEIVCAVGNFNNDTQRVAIIAIYLPPKQRKETTTEMCIFISDTITKLKTELDNPYIILGGDINRKNVAPAVEDHPDIKQGPVLATRGNTALDLIFSNIGDPKHAASHPPLSADNGPVSDHKILIIQHEIDHIHRYKKIVIKHRINKPDTAAAFRAAVTLEDWHIGMDDSTKSLQALDDRLERILDMTMPWKSFTIKSTDKVWITTEIKRSIRKQRRIYKREGRSPTFILVFFSRNLPAQTTKQKELLPEKNRNKFWDAPGTVICGSIRRVKICLSTGALFVQIRLVEHPQN